MAAKDFSREKRRNVVRARISYCLTLYSVSTFAGLDKPSFQVHFSYD
jgi:hypothetical protein